MTYDTINNDKTIAGKSIDGTAKNLGEVDADVTINDAQTMCGMDSALGHIDQYELVRELGGGGFGTVYLAKDTVAGIEVAVKGLPPIIRNNAEELERIRENFALVSRLHHPYIAAALHLQLARDVHYASEDVRQKLRVMPGETLMVMEYAPGVTLSKWRKQFPEGKVPVEKGLVIVRQVAAALDYAHGQRILHRDIKPANVMVETKEDGSLVTRVLDFGLAAEIRSSLGHVSREIRDTSGTRPYMAPEQWVGAKQGPATDQYALAVLFCELVTGEVPFASVFETNDPMVMLNAVRGEPYVPPPDLPKAMRTALVRALSKKPGKRFASCTAFANALDGAGLRWQGPVLSVLVLFALGAVVYLLCGLDFGAGQRDKTQRLKDAAIELRERARLAHEDAEKRGFASDEALARLYREFERCYRAGMESYDSGNYVSATNFFERAGEGMRQLAAEKRRLDAVRESAEAQDRKAAEQRHSKAKKRLDALDAEGERQKGVETGRQKVAKEEATKQFIDALKEERYEDAARLIDSIDRDDSGVQHCLGSMYSYGAGVPQDDVAAVKWTRKAAERGQAGAQFDLGVFYSEGKGVAKDDAMAVEWYRKAAEQGHAGAQNNLGVRYENGSGVTKDYAEAVKWYRKAAEQCDATGEFNLGDMYEYGKGVEKDKAEAIKWYRKAAEQGHDSAKKRLEALTAEQTTNTVVGDVRRTPVARNEIDGQSLGIYCNTFKVKDGDTPVVVSTAWGINPRRLIHAEDLKGVEDYRDTKDLVSRMLAESNIQEGYDVARGRIVTIGTWGFSIGGGASDVDETNYEIDCGLPDSADDDFEVKRFKAMWKAYAKALAKIAQIYATKVETSKSTTEPDGVTNEVAGVITETIAMASKQLAGVTFLTMAESRAGGRYEISVAMCLSDKRKEAYSSRETGSGACHGRYSIFEWLERISKIGMICPQAYCDKDGVWWRIAGVPVGLDGKRIKLEKSLMAAKHYAYEASLRTIEVQVSSERRLTSVATKRPGDALRVDERLKEHIKIDPVTVIPPYSITIMESIDPLTGKSVRLAVAFLSEKDVSMRVPEKAGDGSSR